MDSAGGSFLTDLQHPQNTVTAAVITMLTFVGTGTKRGSKVTRSKAACDNGAGT